MIKEVVKVSEFKTNTATSKRIVIPKTIVEAMGLKKGDQLVLQYEAGEIKIKRF